NYIFEDLDEIYPIFNYKLNEYAVEVLVMYHDQIFSAEYLPLKKGEYYLSPSHKNIHDIYVPSITKKTPFLKIENEHVFIENIEDYQLLLLKNQTSSVDTKSSFVLDDDQIVRFQKNHHQIFIRKVNAPPAVKSPPFMGRDKRLLKSLIPAVLFILVAFIVSELLVTFEEAPPKQVERIVTIYRPKADLVIKKEEKKIVEEKTLSPVTETKPVVTKPLPAAPKVSPKPKPVTPPKLQIKTPIKYQPKMGGITTPNPVIPPSLKKAPAPFNPALKPTVKATPVEIKTYKPIVMPNNMGSILKKDSNVLEAKIESNKNISENFGIGTPHKVTGGNAQGKVDRAFVQGSATNLSGNVTGKIDSSVEASGLIQKDQIIVAEVPDDISIQGSIDPSAVQKKIREHIPQYQYCDQKTMNGSLSTSGTKFPIRFSIGADGRATQISLEGNLNSAFKNCMITVFRNIQFPKPKGGGSVIVTQSLYFRQRN
ncbi:MAG: AgmX/PglI C-terminal domain-containing protein, partial [Bacteriovoracaceae bacterium]|nr:AgmX/PglI C-terminal domain-containing protein [Bacteriovoracaceae bacterium]